MSMPSRRRREECPDRVGTAEDLRRRL